MHEKLQGVGSVIRRVAGWPAYVRDIYTAYDILIDPVSRWLVLTDMDIQARSGHRYTDRRVRLTLQFMPETVQEQVKNDIQLALAGPKGGKNE